MKKIALFALILSASSGLNATYYYCGDAPQGPTYYPNQYNDQDFLRHQGVYHQGDFQRDQRHLDQGREFRHDQEVNTYHDSSIQRQNWNAPRDQIERDQLQRDQLQNDSGYFDSSIQRQDHYYQSNPNQQRDSVHNDQDLTQRIQQELNRSGSNFRNVSIEVYEGVVTLSGSVDNDREKQQVHQRIQNVQGVKNVENKLEVRHQDKTLSQNTEANRYHQGALANDQRPVSEEDNQLKQKIKDSLRGGFFTRGYEEVQVDVRNGNVTLTGNVESEDDKKSVVDKVQKINGVRNVNNQVTVHKK